MGTKGMSSLNEDNVRRMVGEEVCKRLRATARTVHGDEVIIHGYWLTDLPQATDTETPATHETNELTRGDE